eukprot:g23172.t1
MAAPAARGQDRKATSPTLPVGAQSPPVPAQIAFSRHARPAEPPSMHCPPSLPSSWQTDFELDLQAPFVGRGAFAQVLRTKELNAFEADRKTGKIWAVKMLNKPAFACRGIEGQIWAEQGRGRRVAQLAEAVDENDLVYLRLALCACDLQQVLDRRGRCPFQQDIKPSNLLLDDGNLRITDFGWCCDLSDCERSLAGTFQYMAPEVLKLEPQSQAVDLWSAGATLFQLLTGHHLLPGPVSGLSHIDPQRATAFKVAALLAEIARCCPLGDDSHRFNKCCNWVGSKQDACAGFIASKCSCGNYRLVFNAPVTLWFMSACFLVFASAARSELVKNLFRSPVWYEVKNMGVYLATPFRFVLHIFGHGRYRAPGDIPMTLILAIVIFILPEIQAYGSQDGISHTAHAVGGLVGALAAYGAQGHATMSEEALRSRAPASGGHAVQMMTWR